MSHAKHNESPERIRSQLAQALEHIRLHAGDTLSLDNEVRKVQG